jgi:hypothetical protein
MNAKLKTRKEANGTYSWKVSTADYPGVWERTEAVTPWGARAQGMPYLRLLAEGEEIRKRLEEKAKAHHEKYGRYTEDFAPTWMN